MSTDLTIVVDERAHWWLEARRHFQQLADLPFPEDADEIAWRLADFASISAREFLRRAGVAPPGAAFAAAFGDDEPDTDADHIPASRVQG